jgi:hypothetical protein
MKKPTLSKVHAEMKELLPQLELPNMGAITKCADCVTVEGDWSLIRLYRAFKKSAPDFVYDKDYFGFVSKSKGMAVKMFGHHQRGNVFKTFSLEVFNA